MRVLIAGVSTRSAAESAARAGFTATGIDSFADLDQHPSVHAIALGRHFTAHAAARATLTLECDAVAYGSNFENHPKAVGTLAAGRALWGNTPAALQRVRDPVLLAQTIGRRGCAVPAVSSKQPGLLNPERGTASWLVKPLASGGGHGVRAWRPTTGLPRGSYLQELVEGTPGSVVFVAAGGRAVPLGITRQLVGEHAFGVAGYRYCGNILTAAGDSGLGGDAALVNRACALAGIVTEEFGLVGLNGIDFVAKDGVPYAVEVNPRWCASMELIELAYGLSVFGAHADACAGGALPKFDLVEARRGAVPVGKAVVFARQDVVVGDTRAWWRPCEVGALAPVRDVPRPGERIFAGRPVCTVFAAGRDTPDCYAALVERAERVYADLAAWPQGPGRGSRPQTSLTETS